MPELDNAPQKKPTGANYWMGQVDATLTGLKDLFEKSVEADRHNWIDERAWRSTISVAINGLDKRLFALETKVKGPPSDADDLLEKKAITWKWLMDKLAAPVIVAVVIFLLINLFPQIITHLATP